VNGDKVAADKNSSQAKQGILRDGRFVWGMYKGRAVSEVPDHYLQFLIESSRATIDELQHELDRRALTAEAALTWRQKIVEAGFRELAKKHHPDLNGGNGAEMRELLASIAQLRELVSE
jgi:hypothetical protein